MNSMSEPFIDSFLGQKPMDPQFQEDLINFESILEGHDLRAGLDYDLNQIVDDVLSSECRSTPEAESPPQLYQTNPSPHHDRTPVQPTPRTCSQSTPDAESPPRHYHTTPSPQRNFHNPSPQHIFQLNSRTCSKSNPSPQSETRHIDNFIRQQFYPTNPVQQNCTQQFQTNSNSCHASCTSNSSPSISPPPEYTQYEPQQPQYQTKITYAPKTDYPRQVEYTHQPQQIKYHPQSYEQKPQQTVYHIQAPQQQVPKPTPKPQVIKVLDNVKLLQASSVQSSSNVIVLDSCQTISANPGQTILFTGNDGKIQQLLIPQMSNTQKSNSPQYTTIQSKPATSQILTTVDIPEINVISKQEPPQQRQATFVNIDEYVSHNDHHLDSKRVKLDVERVEIMDDGNSDEDCITDKYLPETRGKDKAKITEEEMRLLAQEGHDADDYVNSKELTTRQEKELKKVRRKIRNKRSAHESRKRRKEFMDNLQENYTSITEENKQLQSRVKELESQNSSLRSQIQKLKTFIAAASARTAQATTCVMLLVLSLAFFLAPNYGPLSIFTKGKSTNSKQLSVYDSNSDQFKGQPLFVSRRILQLHDRDGNLLDEPIINEPEELEDSRVKLEPLPIANTEYKDAIDKPVQITKSETDRMISKSLTASLRRRKKLKIENSPEVHKSVKIEYIPKLLTTSL